MLSRNDQLAALSFSKETITTKLQALLTYGNSTPMIPDLNLKENVEIKDSCEFFFSLDYQVVFPTTLG